MLKISYFVSVALLVTSVLTSVYGAETPVSSVTGVSSSSAPSVLNNVYVNFQSLYFGAPMNNMASTQTVDSKGKISSKSSIFFDNTLNAGYKVTPGLGVGVDVPFVLVPVKGQGASIGDVGLKVSQKIYSNGGFSLSSSYGLQAATAASSQARGMKWAAKVGPTLNYNIPSSRFTLGSRIEGKEYFGVTSGKTFKLWANPYLTYQAFQTVALSLQYAREWNHFPGEASGKLTTTCAEVLPGVIWNITPRISFNPYVRFNTTEEAGLDRASLGAFLYATLL